MKIGGTNGVNGPQRVYPNFGKGQTAGAEVPPAKGDRVEISDEARLRDAVSRIPDIRADKVAQARESIASGEMDTPERMDVALDRLLNDLMGDYAP